MTATLEDNQLSLNGSFFNLQSDVATQVNGGAHLHIGLAGENGPVAFPLTIDFGFSPTGGIIDPIKNTFTLDNAQIEALQERRMYVNIHSMDFLAGEIRGQLVPKGSTHFRANFSGRAEVFPAIANDSKGVGSALLELHEDSLIVSGSFTGLQADLATDINGGVHLHVGDLDTNGPVIFPLVVTPGEDGRSGQFSSSQNRFKLSPQQVQFLHEGSMYINVHSRNFLAGELRGQVVPDSALVVEAFLSAKNQSELNVGGNGSGGLIAVLQGNRLKVGGSFINMTSELATDIRGGAHLHIARPTEDGDIKFDLLAMLAPDKLSGTFRIEDNTLQLDQDQIDALRQGLFYVNVHSLNHLTGELRGQVLASTNQAPPTSEIISPENGSTVVIPTNLAGNLEAEWKGIVDPNGDEVFYIWEVAFSPDYTGPVVSLPFTTTSTSFSFLLVETLLAQLELEIGPEGLLLYHRVVTTDGSLHVIGEVGSILLTRESLSVEDEREISVFGNAQVYPNPVQKLATLQFDLAEPATVSVELFNTVGTTLRTLPAQWTNAGTNNVLHLDLADVQAGVYTYRLTATTRSGQQTTTGRITVVK